MAAISLRACAQATSVQPPILSKPCVRFPAPPPRWRTPRRTCTQRCQAEAANIFPPSSTVHKANGYNLRLYEPHTVLECAYESRGEAYDAIAGYFRGMNAEGTKYEETQPIVLNYFPDGSKRMQAFVGPSRGSGSAADAGAAQPQLPGCRLAPAGGELCAVLRFEGYITPTTAASAVRVLKQLLDRDGMQLAEAEAAGYFRILQYGPVYSFSGRENELILKLQM